MGLFSSGIDATVEYWKARKQRKWDKASATKAFERQQILNNQANSWQLDHNTTAYERSLELNTINFGRNKFMSDTAYRRGMLDMKKAGLNPILAFSQGGASSAFSGMSMPGQGGAPGPGGAPQAASSKFGDMALGSKYAKNKAALTQAALMQSQLATAATAQDLNRAQTALSGQKSEGVRFDNARKQVEYDVITTARDAAARWGPNMLDKAKAALNKSLPSSHHKYKRNPSRSGSSMSDYRRKQQQKKLYKKDFNIK